MDAILVTGATGFIGRQLLQRLRQRSLPVLALVRPREGQSAEDRLRELGLAGEGVVAVEGDLTMPGLGLSDRKLYDVRLSHVFHLGALYDLGADAETLQRVNVGGTRHLIDWLKGREFFGCFHHVSSIAVAGAHKGAFAETDFDVGQSFPHAYHQSKFDSEKLVREANLPRIRVYRPGAVIGHSETGEADRIDGFYYGLALVRALRELFPPWVRVPVPAMGTLPLAPVDKVAEAIDAIAFAPGHDGKTFHVFDPHSPSFVHALNLASRAARGPRLVENRLARKLSALPVLQAVQQTGSFKYYRDELARELGLPAVDATSLPRAKFATSQFEQACADAGVRFPAARDYLRPVWDYYDKVLDTFGDAERTRRQYFEGRVVLVTGGSSGVGEALAYELGSLGATVIVAARREAELRQVVKRITDAGGSASHVVADLAEMSLCDAAVAKVLQEHGRIDVLINNAGHSIRRPAAEQLERFHDVERLMRINYFAPARLIRGALPSMRERGFGHIVNILSAGARFPAPLFGGYTASKAALAQFGDTLAAELVHENIHVTAVFLPFVRTPMMEATGKYDELKVMSPQAAAQWILDGTARQKNHIASAIAKAGHGWNVLMPKAVTRALSTVSRIYADNPNDFPEFALDRTLARQFYRGQPV